MKESSRFINELRTGFFAPIDSLKFLLRNKTLLFIGVAPVIVGAVGYAWFLKDIAAPYLTQTLSSWGWIHMADSSGTPASVTLGLSIVGLIVFSLVGFPVVNIIASPIYDVLASRSFELHSTQKLPSTTLKSILRSLVSESLKAACILLAYLAAFVLPIWSPVLFLLSLWFFGWDIQDRTLAQLNLSLSQRISYGIRHSAACIALGIWLYIPFLGTLFSFCFVTAGALTVSGIRDKRILNTLLNGSSSHGA